MKKRADKTPADWAARDYAVKVLVGKAGVKMRDQLDQLDWALSFSQRPTAEILALADGPLDMIRGETLAFLGHYAAAHISDEVIAGLSPAAIADLSSKTAQGIKSYLKPSGWTLPPTSIHISRAADGTTEAIRGITFETAFLSTVGNLLIEEGERVSPCPRPGCARLFAKRKRGLYCSTRCAAQVRTERFNLRRYERLQDQKQEK